MKTVLLVTSAFDLVGGIHTFNRALIRALDELAAERDQVVVLSLLDAPLRPEAPPFGRCGRTEFHGFRGHKLRFALAAVAFSGKADRVIFGHVNLVSLALGMRPGRKSMVVHGIEVWRRLGLLKTIGISRLTDILAVSLHTRDTMVGMNGVPPARFHWFPNTLDPAALESAKLNPAANDCGSARAALGLPHGPMLLTVTRLCSAEPYKHVDSVIAAMGLICRELHDAFLVVVGDGDDRERLQDTAERLGLSKHVRFTGAVPDAMLSLHYSACDLFVLPSVGEGFGIVFLEAMQRRKPCIGARAGAVPEVIRDGRSGLLVKTVDTHSISDCAIRILTNSEEAAAMGEVGISIYEQEFSFEMFRRRLNAILHETTVRLPEASS